MIQVTNLHKLPIHPVLLLEPHFCLATTTDWCPCANYTGAREQITPDDNNMGWFADK